MLKEKYDLQPFIEVYYVNNKQLEEIAKDVLKERVGLDFPVEVSYDKETLRGLILIPDGWVEGLSPGEYNGMVNDFFKDVSWDESRELFDKVMVLLFGDNVTGGIAYHAREYFFDEEDFDFEFQLPTAPLKRNER